MYTSGSTGQPKGVAVPHQGLVNLLAWQERHPNLPPPVRTLQFASLSFDVSFQEIFSTLTTGGTLVLIDEELRREPSLLLAYLASAKIARLFLPPAALAQMAEAATQSNLPDTVRQLYVAGETLQLTKAIERLVNGAVDCKLYNQYGPTEGHVVSEYLVERNSSPFPPIGTPISNQRLYILDENLNAVPPGVMGEVFIASDLLARGYLGRPDATAERFLPDPISNVAGLRMYRTGDAGRWLRSGDIQLSGRMDHQLKIRGFRVEPGEVEAAVAELPGVKQVAVSSWESQPGDRSLVAYVVLNPEATLSVGEMQTLRRKLPEYMIPSRLVILETLPMTPTGKVDRRALPPPDSARPDMEERFTQPSTAIEKTLASIWSTVLGLDSVGVHDNFFALGGHSLRATQVTSRIRKEFDINFPVRLVFENPTIAEMSPVVAQLWADSADAEELAMALDDLENSAGDVPEGDHV
jgi:acyl-coenzyme A synthetase/AMP-(fatty) acid ligase/acyl carrier protein